MPLKKFLNTILKPSGEGAKSPDVPDIPCTTPLKAIDYLDGQIQGKLGRRILKISDAFAHIAAGEHEVTAMTTNHTIFPSPYLHLLATTNGPPIFLSPPSSQPKGLLGNLFFMWMQNPPRDRENPPSEPTYSTIISPSPLLDLGQQNAYEYISALEKNWSLPSLHNHLCILCKVLSEKPVDICFTLSRYIAAMCYKKIACWFNNKALSKPYVDSLKQVKEIPLLSEDRKQATDNQPEAERDDRDEFDSDRLFLKDFLALYRKSPDVFGTSIKNLLNKVDESVMEMRDIELYTNKTCIEFHELLLVLLDCFKQILNTLAPQDRQSSNNSHGQPIKKSLFNQAVCRLQLYGYALLRLGRGRAFRLHLENIETMLDDPCCTNVGALTDVEDQEHDNMLGKEQEEDFDGVLPPQKLKSYIAWLRFMVGHFDAVEILSRFVQSNVFSYKFISLQILVIPPTSSEKLEWHKLFTDNFGTFSMIVLEFLEKGILAAQKPDHALEQHSGKVVKNKTIKRRNLIRKSHLGSGLPWAALGMIGWV